MEIRGCLDLWQAHRCVTWGESRFGCRRAVGPCARDSRAALHRPPHTLRSIIQTSAVLQYRRPASCEHLHHSGAALCQSAGRRVPEYPSAVPGEVARSWLSPMALAGHCAATERVPGCRRDCPFRCRPPAAWPCRPGREARLYGVAPSPGWRPRPFRQDCHADAHRPAQACHCGNADRRAPKPPTRPVRGNARRRRAKSGVWSPGPVSVMRKVRPSFELQQEPIFLDLPSPQDKNKNRTYFDSLPYTPSPAAQPLAQAHWKLYPPSQPVTSTASPITNRPGTDLAIRFCCESASVSTPPKVTSALA